MEAALTLIGVIAGATIMGLFGRRQSAGAAASQFADAAAALITPMSLELANVRAELMEVRSRVVALELENGLLHDENDVLRTRVTALEDQVRSLGHVPIDTPQARRRRTQP